MKINLDSKTIALPDTPIRIKKITGTRFAAILGLNPWPNSTPFASWCDMTGTYKIPFEGNKYTIAGAIIEPIVIDYLDKKYYYGKGMLKSPEQWLGKSKEQLRYDHFHDEPIFGGMWDARTKNSVYELKTSKRVEDWRKNGAFAPPEYYKLQAALYAHLMSLDEFRMVLTILQESDYEHPEKFVPTPDNTIVKKYSLAAEYPDFVSKLDYCLEWYERHITGHVSPVWEDKKDADIIKALTTAHIIPAKDSDQCDPITVLISEIEPLQLKVDAANASIEADTKRLDDLKKRLKSELQAHMKESDKKIVMDGGAYSFEVSRAPASGLDTDALKAAGLYDTYRKGGFTYKLNVKKMEESA